MPIELRDWIDEVRKRLRWSRGLWIRDLIEREREASRQLLAAEEQEPYKSHAATPQRPISRSGRKHQQSA